MNAFRVLDQLPPRVIDHEIMSCSTPAELLRIKGITLYPGRSLATAREQDVVLLDANLQSEISWITSHYHRVGLGAPPQIVWGGSLSKFPDHQVEVFFFGERAHVLRPDDQWLAITSRMNNKNATLELARALNVPTPPTLTFASQQAINGTVIRYPCFVKKALSISGMGVFHCRNSNDFAQAISQCEGGLQVQEPVDATFINVQYYAVDGCAHRLLVTEQLLDGNVHQGNCYPTRYDNPWPVTDPLAHHMAINGMKGFFAFDVAATPDGKYLVIECNPRVNGATYPTVIAHRLVIGQWSTRNLETQRRTLNLLEIADLEFDPMRPSRGGVIIYNWGTVSQGKIGVMFVGTADQQAALYKALSSRL